MALQNQLTPQHHKLPTGEVVSDPVKGDFLAIPLFGWVSLRHKTQTPLVMLTVLLIRSLEDPQPRGTLRIELPILKETELNTVRCLERFGWDGRVWPVDDGWPTGSEDDEEQLIELMSSAGLRATITFPPGEQGIQAQPVSVQRARGPFLMPPLEDDEIDCKAENVEKLKELCENPRIFHRPMKPATISLEDDPEGTRKLCNQLLSTKTNRIARDLKRACRKFSIAISGLSERPEELAKLSSFAFVNNSGVKQRIQEAAVTLKTEEAKLLAAVMVVVAEHLEYLEDKRAKEQPLTTGVKDDG